MSFSEWREVKLEEIIEIEMGQSPKSEFYNQTGEGLPFLQGNRTFGDKYPYFDTYCTENKKIANTNDVIMSVRAPVGDLNIAQTKISLGRGVCAMRLKGEQNSNYLFYLMKHNIKEMINRESGTVFGSVNKKDILGLEVKITNNKFEQKAIAHILSTLDDKIEVNNQMNKTLENMAQAIFKQWFVDFEFPNEDGEPYKPSGGEMVESELGLIPKGWGVEEIGNISDIQNGFAFKAPEYVDEGVKVLRTLNIGNDGYFNNTDIVFLPQSYKSEKYEKYYFEEFDVALVMVGASIGKIGMILKNTAGGLQNQNMWRFRRKEKRVSQIFIYYTVKQAQNISKNWSTGSARDFYRKDSFRKIKVILPEKRIMDLFEKITKPIFQNISNHVCENDELISMRDGLLPKLMSGEIRVPLDEEGDA